VTPSCHKGRERRRLKEEIVHALMDLTRLRQIRYLRRITVRQSRCSTSGTLQLNRARARIATGDDPDASPVSVDQTGSIPLRLTFSHLVFPNARTLDPRPAIEGCRNWMTI
jgi:hypothetical protein